MLLGIVQDNLEDTLFHRRELNKLIQIVGKAVEMGEAELEAATGSEGSYKRMQEFYKQMQERSAQRRNSYSSRLKRLRYLWIFFACLVIAWGWIIYVDLHTVYLPSSQIPLQLLKL